MATNYTALGTLTLVATITTPADDAAELGATALENTAEDLLGRVEVNLQTQGSARAADAELSLLLVPEGQTDNYGDTSTLRTASNHIARDVTGAPVTWALDAAVTARTLTWDGIRVPAGKYKIGLLNETGQALVASNTIYYATYSYEDV